MRTSHRFALLLAAFAVAAAPAAHALGSAEAGAGRGLQIPDWLMVGAGAFLGLLSVVARHRHAARVRRN